MHPGTRRSRPIPMNNIMVTFHAYEDYPEIKLVQREER